MKRHFGPTVAFVLVVSTLLCFGQTSFYIQGLLRQPDAKTAQVYLGIFTNLYTGGGGSTGGVAIAVGPQLTGTTNGGGTLVTVSFPDAATTNFVNAVASAVSNSLYVLLSNPTNVYASNIVSGGLLADATISTNAPWVGSFLNFNGSRDWTQDGSTLTNLLASDGSAVASTDYVNKAVSSIGIHEFLTGTTNVGSLAGRTNNWQSQETVPSVSFTQTLNHLISGDYIRNSVTTNTFTRLEAGPVDVEVYLYHTGGNVIIHPEFYIYDTVSNTLPVEMVAAPPQTITDTSPALYHWSVVMTSISWTNPVKVVLAWKADNTPGGGVSVSFVGGGSFDSHFTLIQSLATISDLTVNSITAQQGAISNYDYAIAGLSNQITSGTLTNKLPATNITGTLDYSQMPSKVSGLFYFSPYMATVPFISMAISNGVVQTMVSASNNFAIDTFEDYPVGAIDAAHLTNGLGFDNAYVALSNGQSIGTFTFQDGPDRYLALTNAEYIRRFSWSNNWNTLRIYVLFSVGAGGTTNIGTGIPVDFAVGVSSSAGGGIGGWLSSSCSNFYGAALTNTLRWNYNANAGFPEYAPNSVGFTPGRLASKVLTNFGTSSLGICPAYGIAPYRRNVLVVQIEKGLVQSGGVTPYYIGNGTAVKEDFGSARLGASIGVPKWLALSQGDSQITTGTINSVAITENSGNLDCVDIYWGHAGLNEPIQIYAVVVRAWQ